VTFLEVPATLAEWLDGRELTAELYATYTAYSQPYVESMHEGDEFGPLEGDFLSDVADQGEWMYDQAGDAVKRGLGWFEEQMDKASKPLGTIVLVGVGILALLVLGAVAKGR
jgi:hypothetical protein